MQDDLAPDCGRMHRINLLHQIETEPNITVATGHRCTGIQAGCVTAAALTAVRCPSPPTRW